MTSGYKDRIVIVTTHKNTPDKRITMGLFKRIFGKGDTELDKRVNKEVEQIKSGQITKIYPKLNLQLYTTIPGRTTPMEMLPSSMRYLLSKMD